MIMTDKKKKAAFHTCLHELRKEYGHCLDDFFKDNREEFLLSATQDDEKDRPEEYRDRLMRVMTLVQRAFYENCTVPCREEHEEDLSRFRRNIDNLKQDIETGVVNCNRIDKSRHPEWGGAGVVVTANKNRLCRDDILFVCTRFAHVVAWLMERLRDIGEPVIDWQNKYSLYGTMGKAAQDFVEQNGEAGDQAQDLVIYVLEQARAEVSTW